MTKILLDGSRKIGGTNKEGSIKVGLSSSASFVQKNDIKESVDLVNEYNIERDNCDKFRLILTVNPICSNVLYNRKSEILKDEGSDNCISLNYEYWKTDQYTNISKMSSINNESAIDNTEYSDQKLGGFDYKCGVDIFNNHRFRSTDFSIINNVNSSTRNVDFNNISDLKRDNKGYFVKDNMPLFIGGESGFSTGEKFMHVYRMDSILSFDESFKENLKIKDGWYGFENPASIDIPVGVYGRDNKYRINRVLNNKRSGEFVDFYPDRSLFSFMPKYNYFRKREEKNWDYCITYPYKSDKDMFNKVMSSAPNRQNKGNCITIEYINPITVNSGDKIALIKSKIKHNLTTEDFVYINTVDKSLDAKIKPIKVLYVGDPRGAGDYDDYFFCVKLTDVLSLFDPDAEYEKDLGFRKISNNCLCEYYFRIFKKIKNDEKELKSVIGKLGFSTNLFGDRNCEVTFTDTIDVSNLLDNRGRPITDIYFTVIKRNAGYEKWYGPNPITSGKDIEFSHCFGPVSAGINLLQESDNYNVHKLHNIDFNKAVGDNDIIRNTRDYYSGLPNVDSIMLNGQKYITIDQDEFIGDIVEYNPSNDTETVIENIYYRFNTAQRECLTNPSFFKLYVNDIISDDFNPDGKFEAVKENRSIWVDEGREKEIAFNICPEGYFYNPHNKISLRCFNEVCTRSEGILINSKMSVTKEDDYYIIRIKSPKNYGFSRGDKFMLYDRKREMDIWGVLIKVENDTDLFIKTKYEPKADSGGKPRYNVIMTNGDTPEYASFLNNLDQTFVWHRIEKYSEMSTDNKLYNSTYSNGHIYKEEGIILPVMRQDPFGKFGLRNVSGKTSKITQYISTGKEFDTSANRYIPKHKNLICN